MSSRLPARFCLCGQKLFCASFPSGHWSNESKKKQLCFETEGLGIHSRGMRVCGLVIGVAICLCSFTVALPSATRHGTAFLLAKPASLPSLRGGGAKELPPLLNSAGNILNAAKHRLQSVAGVFGLRMSPRDKDYETKVSCAGTYSLSSSAAWRSIDACLFVRDQITHRQGYFCCS
jgi:hypothetical protein